MYVSEIFLSINGEVTAAYQGRLAVFIRLAGCNLAESLSPSSPCSYCDTPNAQYFKQGSEMSVPKIIEKVVEIGKSTKHITITGGEPLLQKKELLKLIMDLNLLGFLITIETNGTIEIPNWGDQVYSWVADWKLPNSGIGTLASLDNIRNILKRRDNTNFLKFVITNYDDFLMACKVVKEIYGYINFAISPDFRLLPVKTLLDWVKKSTDMPSGWSPILNVQIHKILNVQ